MKKRQGFRWKKSTGQQWNRESFFETVLAIGAALVFDVLCAILFLHSAKYILEMVYADIEYSPALTVRVIWLVLLVGIVLESTEYIRRLPAFCIRWGVFLAGTYMTARWVQKEEVWQKLCSGFWQVANVYLESWNAYYGSNWYCPGGAKEFDSFFVEAVLLAALVLLFWLGKLCKKNYCMACLPLILFAAGLMVGNNPSEKGILPLFAGVLLSCSQNSFPTDFRPSEGKKGKFFGKIQYFGWIVSGVIVLLLCSIVPLAGNNLAEKTVTEYAGVAEDRILHTANKISNWELWRMIDDPGNIEKTIEGVLGTTDFNYEQLNNRTPMFDDVPYLRVTLEEMPLDRIYLKGFYADTYSDGIWERKQSVFEEACAEHGFSFETVQEELASLGVEKIKKRYNVPRLLNHSSGLPATVFYYDPSTMKAYLPYFSETEEEGISVEGEGGLKKRLSEEEISLTMWSYAGSFDSRLRTFAQGIAKEWEPWYEQYVREQYLTVPEDMVQVKQVAAELASEDLSRTSLGKVGSENEERLAKAYIVADWMGRNTTYSMVLPRLPWQEDPIEYFLGTSRMGYCMHYASASVMILREMGVPARYASGYVVGRDTFTREKEGYVAEVLDNQAHAWAEIYLDGIGWVPVEVTAGYSALLPTPTPSPTPTNTPTPTPTPTPTFTPTPKPTNTPVPTKTPETTNTPSVTPVGTETPVPTNGAESAEATPVPGTVATLVPTSTPTPTPTPTPVPGSSELGNQVTEMEIGGVEGENEDTEKTENKNPPGTSDALGEENRNWRKTIGKSLLILLAVIGIALVILSPATIVDRFFRLEKMSHRRIRKEMKRHGNCRAIKLLNRAIYRKVCFSGMVKKGCTDKEYESALKENFSVLWPQEWDRYMDIVKAAEFSLRDFTEEEVEFCYKIYRDVIY